MTFTVSAAAFDETDEKIERKLDIEGNNRTSVYNVTGYKPVKTELSQVPVPVTGQIPSDLEGVYLRNGTNTQFDVTHVKIHAFVGAGMLHQIQFRNGAATYSNTYIRTPRFVAEQAAGREIYSVFTDVNSGGKASVEKLVRVEEKMQRGLVPSLGSLEASPGSTSVQYHAGRIFCLQETGYAFVLHPRMLRGRLILDGTGHLETWDGAWQAAFSAHPRVDPESGDFYSLTTDMGGHLYYGRVSNDSVSHFAKIYDHPQGQPRMGWQHDYFLTENYIVFPDISLRFSHEALLTQNSSAFYFDDNYKLRWGVAPRYFKPGDKVQWFQTARAGAIWHVVNGWEEPSENGGSQLVLYAPMFESYPSDVPIHTPSEPPAKLNKWVLDLESGKTIEDRVLLQHGYERPSLNLDYVGKKSRYGYLIDEESAGYMGKGVLKYDLLSEKEVKHFDYGEFFGGEALFVPKEGAVDEDDGYLLELLMSDATAQMLILDAKSMTEVARLHLPQRVPYGVHACWINQQKLAELAK
ncbi:carotenoid oxygenase family protein [Bradyrhizobium sp. AUGA SZCCT0042]|uniref:carotenoid oxygenase family protein n=1 Tax=Bradyrhizobium sp. AUGA SZCCT0042 TaxID=2807651 RepID=UPI001BA5B6C4|nr:carotenoid oxygenase family protein [Bradyrhizobium sp. AUGA SZCCT0042]MBR1301127.1 carotenoid oxygenase family protein [Bradyrhizobium sp. AUGA SZCCT0042]